MGLSDPQVAQAAVIGAMLIDPKCVGPVLHEVKERDFAWAPYRTLYCAIRKLFSDGAPVDEVTLTAAAKEADPSGDWHQLIREIHQVTVTAANVEEYIPILRDDARRERLRTLFERGADALDVEAQREIIQTLNGELVDHRRAKAVDMAAALQDWVERMKTKPDYLTWDFAPLDRRLYVEQGDFVIIGGYPSAGKTAFALTAAWHMAEKKRVGFYSLETSSQKLADRILASVAQIPLGRMKDRALTQEDFDTVVSLSGKIIQRPIRIQPAAGWTADDIIADARANRYEVIFIDYLQLIELGPARDRVQGLTDVSITLHTGGQSSGITVVGLSQLARPERTGGKSKAPRMRDLRETGQWEQDADVVMLLYLEDDNDPNSRRILSVDKNKEGELGKVYMAFDGPTQTFSVHRNQTAPKTQRKDDEGKQYTFTELTGNDPGLPF